METATNIIGKVRYAGRRPASSLPGPGITGGNHLFLAVLVGRGGGEGQNMRGMENNNNRRQTDDDAGPDEKRTLCRHDNSNIAQFRKAV